MRSGGPRSHRLLDRLAGPVAAGQPIRRVRVLVVDDDAAIRAVIATTLSGEGLEVFEADGGGAALDMVTSTHPDVAVLDSDMPLMSGWEVADALRTNPATTAIRTIVLTTQSPRRAGVMSLPAGVDACLRKPFDSHELVAAVKELAAPNRRR